MTYNINLKDKFSHFQVVITTQILNFHYCNLTISQVNLKVGIENLILLISKQGIVTQIFLLIMETQIILLINKG